MKTPSLAGERAAALTERGHTCTQAILLAYASQCGVGLEALNRLGTGFGAGFGRVQSTCGALTGGIAVLGLARGSGQPGDEENKEEVFKMVKALVERFEAEMGATDCLGILKAPITTPEEAEKVREAGLFQERCGKALRTVCAQLDRLLSDGDHPEGLPLAPTKESRRTTDGLR